MNMKGGGGRRERYFFCGWKTLNERKGDLANHRDGKRESGDLVLPHSVEEVKKGENNAMLKFGWEGEVP